MSVVTDSKSTSFGRRLWRDSKLSMASWLSPDSAMLFCNILPSHIKVKGITGWSLVIFRSPKVAGAEADLGMTDTLPLVSTMAKCMSAGVRYDLERMASSMS